MKHFLDEDFLLNSDTAKYLYHTHAANLPIIDYHNHLPQQEVAENKKFASITEVWLKGDHYKWRAMRTNGINEAFITGKETSDWQKFEKWAETVPYTMRNPLYHWTHLELQRYFGETRLLNHETAKAVFDLTNEKLQQGNFSTQKLLERMQVEVICTTDDPIDTLDNHSKFKIQNSKFVMLPTFRPDKSMAIDELGTWNAYINQLEQVVNGEIKDFQRFTDALKSRHDYFAKLGCKLSDHGLEHIYAADFTLKEIEAIFYKARRGSAITDSEKLQFKSAMLYIFALMDAEKGWTQQFHLGALRNNSSRLQSLLGADCGADSIGDFSIAQQMSKFFNRLDKEGKLAKTIIYNLNPAMNEVFATMIGNFQDGTIPGKIQFGSGWWFLDQKDGMTNQINTLSNLGLLSRFVGMLTDSRSFLSFPRHEYFRRILCNILAQDIENGELPNDRKWIGQMVENICYYNAKSYFNF
ncbi:MAG: glucuronate isomerase [Bacteroidota bacterium]|nr:glucuronate isomerase [Bacteroidota bacterium]